VQINSDQKTTNSALYRKFKYDPPFLIKRIFHDFYWNTSDGKILFTFDDGPNPGTTVKILKTLNERKIKALFFCVGDNILNNTGLANEILNEGHTIGNHTFSHKRLTAIDHKEIEYEINTFNILFKDQFGFDAEYFRPPYGRFNLHVRSLLKKKKLKNVMWSLLTFDYKNDLNLIKLGAAEYLKKNSIVVLHDSIKSGNVVTEGINMILEEAGKKGFEIGEPAECLK
jgi:peptidoglycan/xylan/chitin deacetylase (PgdA/CDA1 family)